MPPEAFDGAEPLSRLLDSELSPMPKTFGKDDEPTTAYRYIAAVIYLIWPTNKKAQSQEVSAPFLLAISELKNRKLSVLPGFTHALRITTRSCGLLFSSRVLFWPLRSL